MEVDPDRIEFEAIPRRTFLHLVNESGHAIPTGMAGTYSQGNGRDLIRLNPDELIDPIHTVVTLAHELAHVRLISEGRATAKEFDNELLTDLTTCLFGLGIFLANSPRNWDGQYTRWPGTNLKKPEYMTPPMFGYALAHLAWFRGEENPSWSRYLHANARADFKQALRFPFRTGDSTFRPRKLRTGR